MVFLWDNARCFLWPLAKTMEVFDLQPSVDENKARSLPWCVRMLLLWEGNLMIIESRSETCMHVLINNVIYYIYNYIYTLYTVLCSFWNVRTAWFDIYIKMVSQGTWSLDVPHLLKLKGNGWLRTGIPHDWNRQDASLINSQQFYYHGFTKSL